MSSDRVTVCVALDAVGDLVDNLALARIDQADRLRAERVGESGTPLSVGSILAVLSILFSLILVAAETASEADREAAAQYLYKLSPVGGSVHIGETVARVIVIVV